MYQPEFEAMPRAALEELQLERLRGVLRRVYDNVPLYKEKFDAAGVTPEIESLADLASFPFTVKDDMRSAYPYRHVRSTHARHRARALILGDHRTDHRGRLHRRTTSTAGPT